MRSRRCAAPSAVESKGAGPRTGLPRVSPSRPWGSPRDRRGSAGSAAPPCPSAPPGGVPGTCVSEHVSACPRAKRERAASTPPPAPARRALAVPRPRNGIGTGSLERTSRGLPFPGRTPPRTQMTPSSDTTPRGACSTAPCRASWKASWLAPVPVSARHLASSSRSFPRSFAVAFSHTASFDSTATRAADERNAGRHGATPPRARFAGTPARGGWRNLVGYPRGQRRSQRSAHPLGGVT